MLPFQVDILRKLTSKAPDADGLVILARGLGLRSIVCDMLKVYDEKENLVLLINATEEEERGIGEEIGMKLKAVGYEMPAKDRKAVYLAGGIVSVTSRILVVDMLNSVVPVSHITGLVVLQAENVTTTSLESFIVRLYRENNTTAFLKAFSDQPEAFHFGLSPLQTVLTQLKLRHVHIWPRFHADVDKALEKRKADVIEMYQPMSDSMEEMQTAILECLDATLAEVKRACSAWIETDDLTIDHALFRSFDRIVRSQLDPHWHKISGRTKQLVSDLATLRQLLGYLLSMDCVAFNQFLETVVSTNGVGLGKQDKSSWLYLPAADKLIQTARRRVYLKAAEAAPPTASTSRSDPDAAYWDAQGPSAEEEAAFEEMMMQEGLMSVSPAGKGKQKAWYEKMGVQPVLEEPPKWPLLGEVLDEIEVDLHWAPYDPQAKTTDCVLIMCTSTATCSSLRFYLSNDPEIDPANESGPLIRPTNQYLLRRLKNYFFWKGSVGKMAKNLKGSPHGKGKGVPPLLDEESAQLKRKREYQKTQPAYKRRRMRGGVSSPADTRNGKKGDPTEVDLLLEQDAGEVASNMDSNGIVKEDEDADGLQDAMPETLDEAVFEEYFGVVENEDLIVIRSYSGDDDDRLLEELRPKYIIMYDPDPAFIRRIETYKNLHAGLSMRVYFLMYESSVEEQRFLASVRREKEAFERIIRERQNMAITLEAERRPGERTEDENLRTVSSRKGGGTTSLRTDKPTVLVDVREFRSSLPGLLHAANLVIEPLTLSIGDYILSPEMCVERKAIPDLIQSFNSGRLYQQCELMSIYYRHPILLIEFDQKKSFSLQTYTDPKSTTAAPSDTDLQAKLVLLTLTFPKLRIIWSSSPYVTADIFKELKAGWHEPEAERAVALGAEDQFGNPLNAEGSSDTSVNLVAQELLRTLPGITSKNFRYVMRKTENLEELLSQMTVEQLGELIGLEAARQLLKFADENSID